MCTSAHMVEGGEGRERVGGGGRGGVGGEVRGVGRGEERGRREKMEQPL